MRVLGVDPGLTRCGIGVVDGAPGRILQPVYVDVVRTPADAPIGLRLCAIADAADSATVTAVYAPYGPVGPTRAVRPSPLFLGFAAAAAAGGALAWTAGQNVTIAKAGVFVMVIAGWVVSLCLHEFAHAYVAYRAGDREVAAAGYLTLNPFKYAHPVLSILLPLIFIAQGGIGLPGGAVYLHRHLFRTRAQQSLASAVGPAVNLAAAVISLAAVHLAGGGHLVFWGGVAFFGFLQISATVLNLLPIPGLDGWAMLEPYVSPQTAASADRIKPFGMIAVFILLQARELNTWFFEAIQRLYTLSGVSPLLWQIGYGFFRFWQ